jgi:hypothetical protein
VQQFEDIVEEKFSKIAENLVIDDIAIDYGKAQANPQW